MLRVADAVVSPSKCLRDRLLELGVDGIEVLENGNDRVPSPARREAADGRVRFGFIGAAGITGAILGGAFTQAAATMLGTNALLLVCSALLLAAAALAQVPKPLELDVRRRRRREPEPRGALEAVRQSRLLSALAPMVGCAAVVSAVVDIQFNAVVDEVFAETDAKTAFFGSFFAVLNGLAFLFQLLLVPRLLSRVGVGTALLALPLATPCGTHYSRPAASPLVAGSRR